MTEVQELRRRSGMNLKDAVQKVEPMILDTLDKLLAKNEGSLLSTDKCELHGKQCPLHDVGGHSIIGALCCGYSGMASKASTGPWCREHKARLLAS